MCAPRSQAQDRPRETLQQGPQALGDSLYRHARMLLGSGDHGIAARMLLELRTRLPGHPRAGDALYWRAVALRESANQQSYLRALTDLDMQREQYPRAGTRPASEILELQLCGQLRPRSVSDVGQRCAVRLNAAAIRSCATLQGATARAMAITSLVRAEDPRSMSLVHDYLEPSGGCPEALRRDILVLAAELPAREGEPLLLRASREAAPAIQYRALKLLAEIPSEAAVRRLVEVASSGRLDLARAAVDGLAQNELPIARRALRDLLVTGKNADVRLRAIMSMTDNLRGSEDYDFLLQRFDQMPEADQRQLLRSLGERQDATIREWTIDVASGSARPLPVRVQAIRSLAQDAEGLTLLLKYYDTARAMPLRSHLLRVFASGGEERGREKLWEVARSGADPALRTLAARLLRSEGDGHSP